MDVAETVEVSTTPSPVKSNKKLGVKKKIIRSKYGSQMAHVKKNIKKPKRNVATQTENLDDSFSSSTTSYESFDTDDDIDDYSTATDSSDSFVQTESFSDSDNQSMLSDDHLSDVGLNLDRNSSNQIPSSPSSEETTLAKCTVKMSPKQKKNRKNRKTVTTRSNQQGSGRGKRDKLRKILPNEQAKIEALEKVNNKLNAKIVAYKEKVSAKFKKQQPLKQSSTLPALKSPKKVRQKKQPEINIPLVLSLMYPLNAQNTKWIAVGHNKCNFNVSIAFTGYRQALPLLLDLSDWQQLLLLQSQIFKWFDFDSLQSCLNFSKSQSSIFDSSVMPQTLNNSVQSVVAANASFLRYFRLCTGRYRLHAHKQTIGMGGQM